MQNNQLTKTEQVFFDEAIDIIEQGRTKAYRAINNSMLEMYWLLGKRIVEQEQQGKERAGYGSGLLKRLSTELNSKYSKGYSVQNLRNFRQFYLTFPENKICYTPCSESQGTDNKHIEKRYTVCNESNMSVFSNLNWSHVRSIMRVANEDARLWYLKEAAEQMWSVRRLDRNIGSQYYERILLSQHKDLVKQEMLEKTSDLQTEHLEFIKNPVVAEFLGMSQNTKFTESELEATILCR